MLIGCCYVCCLQLLFVLIIITLLLFDQFNLHIEGTTMNVNLCLCMDFHVSYKCML